MRTSIECLAWASTLLAVLSGCGGSEGASGPAPPPPPPPPAPVATVSVEPGTATLLVGATAQLTATLRDASNNVLAGRSIAWASSHPGSATVSTSGLVTALSPAGPVTISATSEGRTGSALITVLVPVASVTVTGPTRVKVGDTYVYTATARLADGTVVNRAMTWSVANPSRATMTPAGALTPLQSGIIVLRVTIDGQVWEAETTGYDWLAFGGGATFGVALDADVEISNKFGTSELPYLAMGCSGGLFVLFVDTEHFVTANGLVAYAFDLQEPEGATWIEFDLFSALAHPGPSGPTRSFAGRMAAAARWGFAFTEFNGPAKATLFRVTGLGPRLAQFATCPQSSAPMTASPAVEGPREALLAEAGRGSPATAERELRAAFRSAGARMPELGEATGPVLRTRAAIRKQ